MAEGRARGAILRRNTVVDVLDRVLDKGLYLDADLVICVADVPLVAARLKAVVASVETMVAHGLAEERLMGSIPRPAALPAAGAEGGRR